MNITIKMSHDCDYYNFIITIITVTREYYSDAYTTAILRRHICRSKEAAEILFCDCLLFIRQKSFAQTRLPLDFAKNVFTSILVDIAARYSRLVTSVLSK